MVDVHLMANHYHEDLELPLLIFRHFLTIQLAKLVLKMHVFHGLLLQKTLKKLKLLFQVKEHALADILRYCLLDSVQ